MIVHLEVPDGSIHATLHRHLYVTYCGLKIKAREYDYSPKYKNLYIVTNEERDWFINQGECSFEVNCEACILLQLAEDKL